jgi:hypothetical protein
VHGGRDAQSIGRLCRAALYLAQIDGAHCVTSEHVTKIVRIRDGDAALAWERPAPRIQYVAQSDTATSKSATGAGVMLLGAGAVIAFGVWLASAPDPAVPSGSGLRNEPVAAAAIHSSLARDAVSDHAEAPSTSQAPIAPVADTATAVNASAAGTTPFRGIFGPDREQSGDARSESPEATFANVAPAPAAPDVAAPDAMAPPAPGTLPAPETVAPKSMAAEADMALPSSAPARVFLHYADGDAEAEAAAERLKASLRAARVQVAAMSAEPKRLLRPGVTYYFAEDRAAAEDVAARLETVLPSPVRLAVTGAGDGLHAPGTIEVAVPVARTAASR